MENGTWIQIFLSSESSLYNDLSSSQTGMSLEQTANTLEKALVKSNINRSTRSISMFGIFLHILTILWKSAVFFSHQWCIRIGCHFPTNQRLGVTSGTLCSECPGPQKTTTDQDFQTHDYGRPDLPQPLLCIQELEEKKRVCGFDYLLK